MKVTILTIDRRNALTKQYTSETQQLTTLVEEILQEVAKENKQEEKEYKNKTRICIIS